MGEVKKINDEFYIEFFARGLKYQQKAGTDRAKAEELLAAIEGKIAKGEAAMIVRDVDIDIFFHDFGEYAAKTYSPKTLKRYQSTGDHFYSFLKTKFSSLSKLSQVTPQVIEQYKAHLLKITDPREQKLKPKTINLTLLLLKDILEYARKLGYLNDNPAIHTPLLKIKVTQRRFLGEEDLRKMLYSMPMDISVGIETILNSGITAQELVNLKWDNVDLERKVMTIANNNCAGYVRLSRTIPIHPKLFEVLTTLKQKKGRQNTFVLLDRSGQPVLESKLAADLEGVARDNHLEDILNFTSLVKAFAQALIKRRVPLSTLQKILGHDDILKTLLYSRLLLGQADQPV